MMKASDDLEMIVCGAHVAGCMESAGLIDTSTDMELMEFLVEIHGEYCNTYDLEESFVEFAERRLLESFGTAKAE